MVMWSSQALKLQIIRFRRQSQTLNVVASSYLNTGRLDYLLRRVQPWKVEHVLNHCEQCEAKLVKVFPKNPRHRQWTLRQLNWMTVIVFQVLP
jgi:hypothetical protein